ncbi:MAG: efflux RND transporter periplasmic adaptor subunit [Flexilinea sp.]|nr:efflux RND transporter periplasmic adaptor subunit [Flexilinea sp.]
MRKASGKIILFGSILLGLLTAGCSRTTVEETTRIRTLPATTGSIQKVITFVGNITSGQSSELTWATTGVIDHVSVRIGDPVTEGQVLATLADDSLSAAVINAEIPLINAQEELDDVYASETPKRQAYKELKDKESALIDAESFRESLKYPHATVGDIAYWSEQVKIYREVYEEAQASLDDAVSWKHSSNEFEYNQYESRRKAMLNALNKYAEVYNNYLYYSGTATENQIQQAAADIDVAQADYEKALQNFRTYSVYPREKDIAAARLKLDNAQTTYDRRNIVSNINGVVTAINAREGDYVTQGTNAFRLDNTDHLYIPMDISEIDIVSIHDGMKAQIVLDANNKKTYEGVIKTVSASGKSSGNRVTFQTVVEILEPDDKVKIGMTAEVDIILGEARDVLLVPANAIFTDQGTSYVNVYDGTSSYDVPVTVGLMSETVAEITGGFLKEGDPVTVPSIDNSILRDMGISGSEEPEIRNEMPEMRSR